MKLPVRLLALAALCAGVPLADGPGRIASRYIAADFPLTADPNAKQWKDVKGIFAENNARGERVPGHRTEVRSLWTEKNLYFLFVNPYEQLHLKPNPSTTSETNELWNWDVAEVFIGTNFDNIRRYKEFQVSPQGEWVDLDIDRDQKKPESGWVWNSGFEVKARIDEKKKIWYGEMRIPIGKIDTRPPRAGNEMRINFYRIQGPPEQHRGIAWQPTHSRTYHVPEAFGRLILSK
ncbi:MAG: carbohydrate-binding family 9-like protein [Bryobacterales bacterium]|nr:carbohydrate-binding family 9-like protein [Bryobacterales bacterium]